MGVRLGLEAVAHVDAQLGHPGRGIPVVHIVGTNGKGSTAAMVELGLRRLGRRTGMFTSPHLQRVGERVRIEGVAVPDEQIRRASELVVGAERQVGARLSFFEVLTLCALVSFEAAAPDVLVLEAGLGGRLDATRLRTPWHTLITKIARDHERFLGNRLVDIAAEKAAVLTAGVPATSVEQSVEVMPVLRAHARRLGADLHTATPTRRAPKGLPGDHQRQNAALALAVLRRVDAAARPELVDGVRWPGRLERITRGAGEIILDAGHNPDAIAAVGAALRDEPLDVVVFGAQADKDLPRMLERLPPAAARWGVAVGTDADVYAGSAMRTFSAPDDPALSRALGEVLDRGGRALVCGSHVLVGAIRQWLCPRDGADGSDLHLSDPRVPAGSDAHLEPARRDS